MFTSTLAPFPGAVGPGQCVEIMTGAALPQGADAVVMVEYTERDGDAVRVLRAARPGDHVRAAGGDLIVSSRVGAGTRMRISLPRTGEAGNRNRQIAASVEGGVR